MGKTARQTGMTPTELMMHVMEECSVDQMEFLTILAMNSDGSERKIYSNSRSEAEMFGMVHMATAEWATDSEEEEA